MGDGSGDLGAGEGLYRCYQLLVSSRHRESPPSFPRGDLGALNDLSLVLGSGR